jgi:hypothetical protein
LSAIANFKDGVFKDGALIEKEPTMKSRASGARPHIRGRALLRQLFADQQARPARPPAAPVEIAAASVRPALTTLAWLRAFRVDAPAEPSFAPAGKRKADLPAMARDTSRALAAPPRAR